MNALELKAALRRPGRLLRARDPAALDAAVRRMKRIERLLQTEFGLDVYLSCGTLLGAVRTRDFTSIGEDVDLAYLSRERTETGIAEEHRRIVRALGRAGMLIGMSSTGHMHVAVRREDGEGGSEVSAIDVWTSWVREGRFYHYPDVHGQVSADALTPLRRHEFRGERFWVPRDTGLLLEALYGPSWRIPDPSYHSGVPERASIYPGRAGKAHLPECPRRSEGVEIEALANAFLLCQPELENVRRVSATAALILELCDAETPVREIVDEVQRIYALPSAPAAAVIDFLIWAVDEGLIC